jgi:hypothetical protein
MDGTQYKPQGNINEIVKYVTLSVIFQLLSNFFQKIPKICARPSVGSNSAESSIAEYQQNRPSGPSTESKPSTRGISRNY